MIPRIVLIAFTFVGDGHAYQEILWQKLDSHKDFPHGLARVAQDGIGHRRELAASLVFSSYLQFPSRFLEMFPQKVTAASDELLCGGLPGVESYKA